MPEKKKIDRWTLGYLLTKKLLAQTSLWLYYNKIEVANRDKIPIHQPLILTPNHQNALMDALAITVWIKVPVVFLTRADIFEKPLLERILNFYKMLPIFRIRDGRDSLKKNEEIFIESVEVIKNRKSPLGIFPEGSHGEHRKLKNMLKGVFRIAFSAQETYKEQPGVKIIPIGLDYQDYYKFHQNLFINIGDPIEVSSYWNEYVQNPAATINKLREDLGCEIKKLMIHINSEKYYDTFQGLRNIARPYMLKKLGLKDNTLFNRFKADKLLVEKLDLLEETDEPKVILLTENYNHYKQLRDQLNLRDWVFNKQNPSLFLSFASLILNLVLSPVILLGLICNWPIYFIPPVFIKKVKDPQMRSTMSWAIGTGLGAVYYIILFSFGFIFLPTHWMKILFLPFIPLSGIIGYKIRNGLVKSSAIIKYILYKKKNRDLKAAINHHNRIIDIVNDIISA